MVDDSFLRALATSVRSTAVGSYNFGLRDDVALHCLLQRFSVSAVGEAKYGIQRVEPEMIMMHLAGRRARAEVPHASRSVSSLHAATGHLGEFRNVFSHFCDRCWNIIRNPVNKSATWRVRIGNDDRVRARRGRRPGPFERRRMIGARTGEGRADRAVGGE